MKRRVLNTKEIASILGLSRATVSNVINGKGRVSRETRQRVEQLVAESGYVRDQGAVALKTGQSRTVGVLVTDIANPFYGNVISDLEVCLAEAGYSTILGQSRDDKARQAHLIGEFLGFGVSGLIVNPSLGTSAKDFDIVSMRQLPIVLYVRGIVGSHMPLVSLDDWAGGVLLAEHMIEAGYQHFAMIGGFRNTTSFDERLGGVDNVLRKSGLETAITCEGPISEEFGYSEARRLLEEGRPVDGIIGHNDLVALGCLRAVRDVGRVPGLDIGLAGFDNLTFGRVCDPPLTTVDVRETAVGTEAGKLLLGRLADKHSPLVSKRIEPMLIVRGTTTRDK